MVGDMGFDVRSALGRISIRLDNAVREKVSPDALRDILIEVIESELRAAVLAGREQAAQVMADCYGVEIQIRSLPPP